jgi:hypothetical protein
MGLDRYVSHHLVMSALLLLRRRRSTQREELWEVETRHLLIAARAAMFTFAVWASPGQAHASFLGLTSPGVPVVDAGYSWRYRNYYAADYRYRRRRLGRDPRVAEVLASAALAAKHAVFPVSLGRSTSVLWRSGLRRLK